MAIVLPKFPRGSLSSRSVSSRRADPQLELRLLSLQPCFDPNDVLEAEYQIQSDDPDRLAGLEVSVLWITEGKGSEDLGVHFFQRLSAGELRSGNGAIPRSFATQLPSSPLSYEGKLLKIRWCVRLRLFLTDGREMLTQKDFYLGQVTREV